eukprot:6351964-Prymnesium_polylepis.1
MSMVEDKKGGRDIVCTNAQVRESLLGSGCGNTGEAVETYRVKWMKTCTLKSIRARHLGNKAALVEVDVLAVGALL